LEVIVMRASQWLLGGATAATIVAAIASGCGGSTNSNTTQDSGTDATNDVATEAAPKEAAAETGPEAAAETGPTCVADADITKLNPPDAEIGDSGQTAAGCYSCIETTCGSQLSACNADCACNVAVVAFLNCVQGGGAVTTCGAGLATGGGTAGLPLGLCVAGSAVPGGSGPGCLHACGVSLPEGGPPGDGGGDSAGDTGSTDAGGQ
jgi:hypothetical protein